MRVNRAVTDEPGALVHIQIAARTWEEMLDERALVTIFRKMSLNPGVRELTRQAASRGELFLGGRRREPRRDGIAQSLATMPAVNQRAGGTLALLGCFPKILRTISVHQHLAGDHPHLPALRRREKRVD